jgi:hypothetical protein
MSGTGAQVHQVARLHRSAVFADSHLHQTLDTLQYNGSSRRVNCMVIAGTQDNANDFQLAVPDQRLRLGVRQLEPNGTN